MTTENTTALQAAMAFIGTTATDKYGHQYICIGVALDHSPDAGKFGKLGEPCVVLDEYSTTQLIPVSRYRPGMTIDY